MSTIELPVGEFICPANVSGENMEANLRKNMSPFIDSLKLKRACLVGGGPSAADHIEEIRHLQVDGYEIFALNGSAKFLDNAGIRPDWHIIYDSRPCNVEFIGPSPKKGFLVASHVDPSIIANLELRNENVMLFHSAAAAVIPKVVLEIDPSAHILGAAFTVGLQALNIIACAGYRVVRAYGYDSSYRDDATHAYSQPESVGRNRVIHVNHRGVKYTTDGAMAAQAQDFIRSYPIYKRLGINLTVVGDGLLPAMWRAQEDAEERAKYAAMWEKDVYRKASPSEILLPLFISSCNITDADSVIDFGCGTGRAAAKLQESGVKILGIDFAENCLDEGVSIPFLKANLWELPDPIYARVADWGLCCDVMEHIPPEHVDVVIANVARYVTKGAFFSITFVPDNLGALIGQRLHLTIEPHEWWRAKLLKHFHSVEDVEWKEGSDFGVFLCRHA